jgi:pimeloyl-ACP methyl ester carboxylesterase
VKLEPALTEGTVELRDGRKIGYAEYGSPDGLPVLWFHGTPGARGQIPPVARTAAAERGMRIIAVERPGTGGSTRFQHPNFLASTDDIRQFADSLKLDRFGIVGLSGGGPYVLACAYAMPERVVAGIVLGGVAPSRGEEAAAGGIVGILPRFEILLTLVRDPLRFGFTAAARSLRPIGEQTMFLYMLTSPEGDRRVFRRPEMRAMFLDDLNTAARKGLGAAVYDLVLFAREWGFLLRDIRVPIRFWHGDADHIVPLAHGEHQAALVADSELRVRHGESHLGNLDASEEFLDVILSLWPAATPVEPDIATPVEPDIATPVEPDIAPAAASETP